MPGTRLRGARWAWSPSTTSSARFRRCGRICCAAPRRPPSRPIRRSRAPGRWNARGRSASWWPTTSWACPWPTSSRGAGRSTSARQARSCSPWPVPWRSSTAVASSTGRSRSTRCAARHRRPVAPGRAGSDCCSSPSSPIRTSCRRASSSKGMKRWRGSGRARRSFPRSGSGRGRCATRPATSTRWGACSTPSSPARPPAGRGTHSARSPRWRRGGGPSRSRRGGCPWRWRRSSPTSSPAFRPTAIPPPPRRPMRSPPAWVGRRCRPGCRSRSR